MIPALRPGPRLLSPRSPPASSAVVAATDSFRGAPRSPATNAPPTPTTPTGGARSPASAIPRRASSSSASLPALTAPTAPAASSPAIAAAEWLYRALHRAGFANQPTSVARDDGLRLRDCWVTVCVRCAPPDNKPTPGERDACLPFLVDELGLLRRARVLVCLGAFAWDGVLRALAATGAPASPRAARAKFAHAAEAAIGRYTLVGCYHPSQQNTFTGRLTEPMLDAIFTRAHALAAAA